MAEMSKRRLFWVRTLGGMVLALIAMLFVGGSWSWTLGPMGFVLLLNGMGEMMARRAFRIWMARHLELFWALPMWGLVGYVGWQGDCRGAVMVAAVTAVVQSVLRYLMVYCERLFERPPLPKMEVFVGLNVSEALADVMIDADAGVREERH